MLFADDHWVFMEAVTSLLQAEPDIDVVGLVTTAADTARAARSMNPDVILVDVDLGPSNGVKLTQTLRQQCPNTKIVVLTCHEDAQTACAAIRAGASGFVPKAATVESLVEAIRSVHRGESWVPAQLLTEVLRRLQEPARAMSEEEKTLSLLSSREQEVLVLLASGYDRAYIAKHLYLSPNTVRTHVQNILAKLGVHSSLEAVGIANRAGLGSDGFTPTGRRCRRA